MKIDVRLMNDKDHEQVLSLYEEVFNKKQVHNYHITDSNAYFIIAVAEEKIVGLIQLDIITDVFKGIKYGYINSVCVNPNYRRLGIGDMMIDKTEEIAKNSNCSYIELTSSNSKEAAHKLYFKHNYQIRNTNVFKNDLI